MSKVKDELKTVRILAKDARQQVLTNRRNNIENILKELTPIYALITKAIEQDMMYVDVYTGDLTFEGIELLKKDGYNVIINHHYCDSSHNYITRIGFDA